MSEGVLEESEPSQARPVLLGALSGLPWPLKLAAAVLVISAPLAAGHWGFYHHPDYQVARGAEAEERIAELFGAPSEAADEELVGDLLIERFYAVEPATGRRMVGDMCKGRVKHLVESVQPSGKVTYSVILDRRGLDPAAIRKMMEEHSPPDPGAVYMGVRIQGGNDEVFNVNYSGRLPSKRAEFVSKAGDDTYTYLSTLKTADIGRAYVLPVEENNYLLSSTAVYPYFTSMFRVQDAVFITELQFLDATSAEATNAAGQ